MATRQRPIEALLGTANMDNRSFRLNFEVTALLYGPEHAKGLAARLREDLGGAHEVKAGARQLSPPL